MKRGSAKRNPRKQPGMLLDHALYLRFKTAAALRGIYVGEALDKERADYLERQGDEL